jgi:hypothetical protein
MTEKNLQLVNKDYFFGGFSVDRLVRWRKTTQRVTLVAVTLCRTCDFAFSFPSFVGLAGCLCLLSDL